MSAARLTRNPLGGWPTTLVLQLAPHDHHSFVAVPRQNCTLCSPVRRRNPYPTTFRPAIAVGGTPMPTPPTIIAIDHDNYHASHVGHTHDGHQFFLTTPFVPPDR